jgi:hypothetical protein
LAATAFDLGIGRPIAARHQSRTKTRAFFSTAHTGADEPQPFGGEVFLAADRVGPQCVAAVDHDVVFLQQRSQGVDHRIGWRAGLDQNDHPAGFRQ